MSFRTLIRSEILEMAAYRAEEGDVPVRLDANENPYNFSEGLLKKLFANLAEVPLNRYPDPHGKALKEVLASKLGVAEDGILLGNGSDEILQALMLTFWSEGARIMVPAPTFGMYSIIGRMVGFEVLEVPLDDEFDLRVDEMVSLAGREGVKLIFLASPNNPTGNCFSEDRIIALLENTGAVVVVDEAYAAFSGQDFLAKLERYENLVVLRTLSKIGMAALRVGMMFAAESLIYEVNKARLPYNVNSLSQRAAAFILERDAELREQIARIVEGRKWLMAEMESIPGIRVYPSDANIILFRTPGPDKAIFQGLLDEGVLIRNLSRPGRLYNCFRVCVGTEDENRLFVAALRKSLAG